MKRNNNLLSQEIKKAVLSKGMFGSAVISIILVFVYTYYYLGLSEYYEFIKNGQDVYREFNYNEPVGLWIIAYGNPYVYYLYYLIPILAVLPYGMSFYNDISSGVIKNYFIRCSRKKYVFCKFIATYIAGGMATTLPIILSLLINMFYIPIQNTSPIFMGFSNPHWLEKLYFTNTFAFVFIYIMIYFLVGGLLATLSLTMATYIKNMLTVLLTPVFVMLILLYIQQRISIIKSLQFLDAYFPYSFMICYCAKGGTLLIILGIVGLTILNYVVFRKRVIVREVF